MPIELPDLPEGWRLTSLRWDWDYVHHRDSWCAEVHCDRGGWTQGYASSPRSAMFDAIGIIERGEFWLPMSGAKTAKETFDIMSIIKIKEQPPLKRRV